MLDIFAYAAFAGLCVIIIMAAIELFIDVCAKISNLIFMWMKIRKSNICPVCSWPLEITNTPKKSGWNEEW